MQNPPLKDIINWDITNWSKAIPFWEKHADLNSYKLKCLELGGNHGGLSLWLAQKGHQVICSDLKNPEKISKQLHEKYGELSISYQGINALDIPYENEFDIIIFKSILGGVSRGNRNERKQQTINQIYKALKPGGKLLFAENLVASPLHRFFRNNFVRWGNDWNYLSISEVESLFSDFETFKYKTVGFLGTFGRNEKQRIFLGKIDVILHPFLKEKHQYILIAYAKK